MCGICGIAGSRYGNKEILKQMCRLLQHRGPDKNGFYFDNDIALGHQRLSIIDLFGGDQPIYNEDKSIVVIYNGEIYNFRDFRGKLMERGHQFSTQSDTEILVHAYEEYDTSFIKDLNGIFAFALYDTYKKRLLLARDHFGIKPLHYWHQGGTFIFASEQKAILAHPAVTREINYNALHCQVNLRYTQSSETLFKNIFRVPPGHYMIFENNKLLSRRYYYLPLNLNYNLKESNLTEAIHNHLQTAVKRQLISDVPIGVYLSGGMDSSTIVALMHELNVEKINTFTLGFNEKTDEFPDAALVAETFGTNHHTDSLDFDPLKQFPEVIWHAEEPKINLLQGFNMSGMVSPDYKVILGGLGGDELFAGYDINRFINIPRYFFKLIPQKMQKILFEPVSHLLFRIQNNTGTLKFDEYRRGLQMLLSLGNLEKYYLILRNVWDYDRAFYRKIYQPGFQTSSFLPVRAYFEPVFNETVDLPVMDRIAYVEFHSKMINDYLLVDDRMSMAHSVELRVPFLDRDLVEFMFTIPMSMKMKGSTTKHLFRESMRSRLPEQIISKRKWGFTVNPFEQFKKDLKTVSQKILTEDFITRQGIFNYSYIKQILDYPPHPALRWHYNYLWIVLGLAIWQKMYIDSDMFLTRSFHLEDYFS